MKYQVFHLITAILNMIGRGFCYVSYFLTPRCSTEMFRSLGCEVLFKLLCKLLLFFAGTWEIQEVGHAEGSRHIQGGWNRKALTVIHSSIELISEDSATLQNSSGRLCSIWWTTFIYKVFMLDKSKAMLIKIIIIHRNDLYLHTLEFSL